MKASIILCITVFAITCSLSANAQESPDSAYGRFSDNLRKQIYTSLDEMNRNNAGSLDSVNFIDIHVIKIKIDATGRTMEAIHLSKGAPPMLKSILTSCIDSVLNGDRRYSNSAVLFANRTFILPICFDYDVYPGKGIARKPSTGSIVNMTLFDDAPTKETRATPFVNSGIPVEGILLPVFFYQPPHMSGWKPSK